MLSSQRHLTINQPNADQTTLAILDTNVINHIRFTAAHLYT